MTERPERNERDVEAEFAAIIARWDDAPATRLTAETDDPQTDDPQSHDPQNHDPQSHDPQSHDPQTDPQTDGESSGPPAGEAATAGATTTGEMSADATTTDDPTETAATDDRSEPGRPNLSSIPVWRGARITPEQAWEAQDQEHYTPPPPAPLPPQEDIQFWGIVVGLVGGPLLLLWLVLFRPSVSDWWTFGALGLTVVGFVLLVLRQPHSRGEDDADNGAIL